MRTAAPSSRRNAGFSLIELMSVVIILGLLASVAVMSWESLLPSTRLNSAVRILSERLAGARSEAIARNTVFEIYYDLDIERYWVRTPYLAIGGKANLEAEFDLEEERAVVDVTNLDEDGIQIHSVTIDDQIYVDGQVFVRFDPLGSSSAHTIVLYHDLFDRYFTVEVLPLTGEIRFHDGLFEREQPRDGAFD